MLKVDDPVGAISVHGTNGLWGVISVGLFADGKSNYGGSWNGVTGSVTGLFYGDAGQLVAQLIGVATLIGFVFTLQLRGQPDHRGWSGQRVSAKAELEGLDMPEMGALGYPEFVLKPEPATSADGELDRCPPHSLPRTTTPVTPGAGVAARRFPGETRTRSRQRSSRRTSQQLEQACLENPQSADLRTCLGMAYAMNYDVYKSMDALEDARRRRSRTTSGRSSSTPSCTTGCARSTAPRRKRCRALELADNPWQLAVARQQLQEIRRLSARGRPQRRTGPSRSTVPCRRWCSLPMIAAVFAVYDVEMKLEVLHRLLHSRRPASCSRRARRSSPWPSASPAPAF